MQISNSARAKCTYDVVVLKTCFSRHLVSARTSSKWCKGRTILSDTKYCDGVGGYTQMNEWIQSHKTNCTPAIYVLSQYRRQLLDNLQELTLTWSVNPCRPNQLLIGWEIEIWSIKKYYRWCRIEQSKCWQNENQKARVQQRSRHY